MARDPLITRAKILDAADHLFYGEGLLAVSMDRIAERAGVTKRTLYYHFQSKDALITAYLEVRDGLTTDRYRAFADEAGAGAPLSQRIAAMFGGLARRAAEPRWQGCGFARAAAELASQPDHPARKVASSHKKAFEAWLEAEIAAAGLPEAPEKARYIMLLFDGAVTAMLIHQDPNYARSAGAAAQHILSHSTVMA